MTELPFLTLFLTVLLGFGSLFGFLHLIWKQLSSNMEEFKKETKADQQNLRLEFKEDLKQMELRLIAFENRLIQMITSLESRIDRKIDILIEMFTVRWGDSETSKKRRRLQG
ncbi:hypothetical protein [Leptospira yasudae]|uniref:hypothetical protein n=1 Tax=Leptospira yasudae TaxID=2202201 RepID=UPI0010916A74|nr:hypothetical protein [Leptospira yasudae]MBW0434614.1 hypothetical protein [Leptospira yasudae]TGM96479.1 hypothetical protein EHR10_17170 [Leptospira yasudae]